MAVISITDQLSMNADLQVSDDSSLALANLKKLNFRSLPIVGDFNKPIDQFPLDEVAVGLDLTSPASLGGNDPHFSIGGGASAAFSICNHKSETLFDDDPFCPPIEIKEGECWAGLCIDLNLQQSAGTSIAGGFGVSAGVSEGVSLGTFVRFPLSGALTLPTLKEGIVTAIQSYSVPRTPDKIRAIPVGIAHTAEMSGTIALGASYSSPLTVNPLATLGLPLNLSLSVAPTVSASVSGSIALEGSFVIRTYRSSTTKLIFGAYKKKKTSLSASLSGIAGVGVDINKTDILAKIMTAIVPPADLQGLQLDDVQTAELRRGLKQCVDQSISLAVNTACVASEADESAVVYELDLAGSDMSLTDIAIARALRGDWAALETLPNARPVRNIVRELHDRKHKLNINLLGLYNATSLSDYLKSTTVLHDEHGQIALIDKASAESLSAGTTPYAAKGDKLRSVLAKAFVASITYAATKGKLGITSFTIRQSLLEYHAKASAADVTPELLLARAIGFEPSLAGDNFNQNKLYVDIAYDDRSVMRLFYRDVENRVAYSSDAIDRVGRDAKVALLNPAAPNSMQRRTALLNDEIWSAMKANGNTSSFKFIPGLARLDPVAVALISSDFLDIRWWSDALHNLAPKLTAVLAAIDQSQSPNPLVDAAFMAAHRNLENALAGLTSKTQSSFSDGWPLAVMYRLATAAPGTPPSVQMDIGWNGKFEHYVSGVEAALGKTSGT